MIANKVIPLAAWYALRYPIGSKPKTAVVYGSGFGKTERIIENRTHNKKVATE